MTDNCPCKHSEVLYKEHLKAAIAQEDPLVRSRCVALVKSARKAATALILPHACSDCPLKNAH